MTGSRHLAARALLAAALGLTAAGMATADSAYGCRDLLRSPVLPVLEGEGGQFFRVDPDLMMDHRLDASTVADIAGLSRALASRGTTLIYVPLPAKALAMPGAVPPEARALGYDPDIAATLYDLTVAALDAAGVRTVNARAALTGPRAGGAPYFAADPHLTAAGALALASDVAAVVTAAPGYGGLEQVTVRGSRAVDEVLASPMRLTIQDHCSGALPPLVAENHRTRLGSADLEVGVMTPAQIGARTPDVVVAGTGIAGLPHSNLAGFVAAFAKLDAAHHAVAGTDPFAALSGYLVSDAFRDAPPAFLVWTHPLWLNLARRGDRPIAEVIAAAGATCDVALALTGDAAGGLRAEMPVGAVGEGRSLRLDAGRAAEAVRFTFEDPEGEVRVRGIWRAPGQDLNGRFFLPLSALWPGGARAVTVTAEGGFGQNAALHLCHMENGV